jgi:hypothetical protein
MHPQKTILDPSGFNLRGAAGSRRNHNSQRSGRSSACGALSDREGSLPPSCSLPVISARRSRLCLELRLTRSLSDAEDVGTSKRRTARPGLIKRPSQQSTHRIFDGPGQKAPPQIVQSHGRIGTYTTDKGGDSSPLYYNCSL